MNVWTLGKLVLLLFWYISFPAAFRIFEGIIVSSGMYWIGMAFWWVLGFHVVLSWFMARELRQVAMPRMPHLLWTWLFGLFHYIPARALCREAAEQHTFLHAYSLRDVPWSVRMIRTFLQGVFGLFALLKRARPTHTKGIVATGFASITPSPELPDHDFFEAGKMYPVVLRHANLTYADCRWRDIRGAALRFGGLEQNGMFDMMMNTGEPSVFWDLPSFLDFLRLNPLPNGLQRYIEKHPLAGPATIDALHRGPESFSRLAYCGQLVYRFVGKDGVLRWIRYRLVPAHHAPNPVTLQDVPAWEHAPDPDDQREPDYLMTEYARRLVQGHIIYKFQAQLREPSEDSEVLHSGYTWDDIPWLDIATITIDTKVSEEEASYLTLNLGNHPRSLGLLPASSWRDYNALALARVAVYRAAAFVRRFGSPFRRPRWDYDLQSPFPRASKPQGKSPQGFSKGRTLLSYTPKMLASLVRYKFTEVLGEIGVLSSEHIQKLHRPNATIRMEAQTPGSSRSDHVFGDRLMNSFYPVPIFQSEQDPNRFIARFCWDHEQFDGSMGLANSEVQLRLENDQLVPEQIAVQFRRQGEVGPHPQLEPDEVVHPGDGDRWELAKLLFQHSHCLEGQALGHFVGCHVNMEQYAVAAYRRLQGHPLAPLLFPHLKGVVEINRQGEGIIFGQTGILCVNSALSAASATSLFVRHLGGLSWSNWRPRQPICHTDQYAYISNLFWDIVREHVRSHIEAKRHDIDKRWMDVYAFSQDLVLHSVAYSPSNEVDHAQRLVGEQGNASSRVTLGGVEKCIPPITLRAFAPEEQDWEHLIQACSYIIFHASLYHTWTNDKMHETLGDLAFMNFGVDDKTLRDAWKKGDNDPLLPPPAPAAYQLFLVNYLVQLRYGLLTANECGDVSQSFIQSLETHRDKFTQWGMNIDLIRTNINI